MGYDTTGVLAYKDSVKVGRGHARKGQNWKLQRWAPLVRHHIGNVSLVGLSLVALRQ